MRGRKPVATELKIVRGTARPDRINAAEPKPSVRLLTPPSHLSEGAKREYKRLGKQLVALRVMTEVDRNALALYCQAWDRAAHATEMLEEQGEVVDTPQGFQVQSPWLQIYNKAVEAMTRIGAGFGLDPSSRSRVKVAEPEKKTSGFAEFMGTGSEG